MGDWVCTDESLTDEERSAARREYKNNYGLPVLPEAAAKRAGPAKAEAPEKATPAKAADPVKSTSGR